MSKYVKEMLIDGIKKELTGVENAFVVSLAGLSAIKNSDIRADLRKKNIHVRVVKNSLARLATKGTPLAPAFEAIDGPCAVVWGSTDVVALAKEITKIADNKALAPFAAKGGAVDGEKVSGEQVKEVSKWPSREEVLSTISAQLLGPGATLNAQLIGIAGTLASQIKKKAEGAEDEAAPAGDAPAGDAPAEAPAAG